ncbi:cell envelope biogenesis protein TonB [Pseudomonas tohonis]|uniref:Protein TonB n=1 Tax=Pseudomonas tohonis TaxID=2725477 RepID=A0A6J4ECG8_9PSED|nr:energy transducer TonB [Pseudomonas tohonis]BCG27049.1 cell envelope biogenesis protein TonB [Pseudomonas tohonis]GJN56101.1 cell envelope biogenesis protein TonB [Pseudomonas tohonis]
MPRLPLCLALSLVAHAGLAWLLHDLRAEPAIARGELRAEVVHLVGLVEPAAAAAEPVLLAAPPPRKVEPESRPVVEARPVAVKPRLASPEAPAAKLARREPRPQPRPQPRPGTVPSVAKAAAPVPSTAPPALASQPVAVAARLPKAEVVSDQPSFLVPPRPPIYPAQARRRNQQGVVLVEVRLDERGGLRDMKLLRSSGIESLDEAAMKAVASWRFRPEVQDGEPVPSRVRIPIEFALTASR